MKYFIIALICISSVSCQSQTSIDTLRIACDMGDFLYTPSRGCIMISDKSNQNNDTMYIDSIKILGITIDKNNTRYYIILKDTDGTVRYEGEYFDEFPDGHIIEYNVDGIKTVEGDYKMITLKRPKVVCKGGKKLYKQNKTVRTGLWKFYDLEGKLKSTKNYK